VLSQRGCSSNESRSFAPDFSLRVPIRVCRPLLTGEALRRSPLMEAGGADTSRVERIPFVSAATRPSVFFAGRPTAERAPNARTGRVEAFLLFGLAINNRGVIRECAHVRLLSPSSDRPMWRKILSLLRKKSRPSCQIVCLRLIERHCRFSRIPFATATVQFYLSCAIRICLRGAQTKCSSAHPTLPSGAETSDRIRPWTYLYSPGIHRTSRDQRM